MASSNTESPGTIYRWIEKKPLTEVVSWTSKEKFWLVLAIYHYGTHDWKKVAQVARHVGESYRPEEWFSPTNCERQFKILVSNLGKEVKSLPFIDMMQHIVEGLRSDYKREVNKSRDALKTKYCNLFNILNRVKQGNLSRSEIVNLYSQARRNEIEGKQYMEQLMTRQNASLASENSSSGLIEEPIKWNTPSAPLLTSLLRSRNTIPANRTTTTITSLLQSPGGTSRTRSGKLLPLTPSIRTTQGTPTLSKLLEAPANPYIPNPPQATQKNKLTEVVAEKLVNTSRKENSQSTSLNKVRVDNMTTLLGSFNQINKSDLSASKKQISKNPVSVVKSGSKANLNVVTLLSDSENDEDKNISLKSLFGDKKDTSNRIEPRATRSQTRAEGGFKQLNDTKLSEGKKDRESLRQQSGGSLINEQHLIDDVIADINQIEVQPLSSVQDEIQTQTPSKMTRSSLQKLRLSSSGNNLLTNNKVNTKEINNKTLEEISTNFVLNSPPKSLPPQYQCLLGEPRNNSSKTSECLIPISTTAVKDAILIRRESQFLQDTLNTSDEKQEGVIEINTSNVIASRNDSKCLSLNDKPVLVVNKIKKPFNIKLTSEQRVDDIQITNTDLKKPMRLNNSSQNVVKLTNKNCTATAAANDNVDNNDIIVDNEIYIDDNKTPVKTKLSSNIESQNVSSIVVSPNISCNSKSTLLQLDEKKNKNAKTPWNMFGKPQNILDSSKKHCHQDNVSKSRINSNISETNNQFIKELDFDFDQSISQTSLTELYNGVEEIVEMHSFDNEELNSLIECGSLDSNETEECRNTVSVDQGDSSVSESDSTIGAFDTFAQITRVRQRSSTSKDIKLGSKELKVTNQGIKHFKESFCQSDKIENDQSSVVSVTGIPILQGVISDVMNQIDLDSVASLTTSNSHNLPSNDVVELISSDEEGTVKNLKACSLNMQNKKIRTQDKEKEEKSYKLKEVELIKLHDTEAKAYKSNNLNCGTSNIQPIQKEMPSCIIVKNPISDTEQLTTNQILKIKKEVTRDNEMVYYSNPYEIININEFDDDEMEPRGIAVKIANEKLLKEAERMRKEAKENEERKRKEDERLKKEEDERLKKEEDERLKKEEDERLKKEECERLKKEEDERLKKEEDKRLKKEEDERLKKEEDERRKKENDDRMKKEKEEEIREFEKLLRNEKKKKEEEEEIRKKEEYNRKINDLQRTIKIGKEQKQEQKTLKEIYEEVKQKRDNLVEYDTIMRNEYKVEMGNNVVVKPQEIINENVDLNEVLIEECFIEDTYFEEIKSRIDTSKVNFKLKNMKIFLSCTEFDQIRRGIELQPIEESLKRRVELKECNRIEDLINQNEISSVSDVLEQNEYNKIPIPTMTNQLEIQTKEAKEDKKQKTIEAKLQRLKEAEIQKVKVAKKQRADEIISREAKKAEIKRVKVSELERIKNERIKRAEEVETKKSKEAELRKNITVKETEIKGLEKRNVLKKVNETGNNRSVGHTEVKSVKNSSKKKNENFQNKKKMDKLFIETSKVPTEHRKSLIETRKVTAKEDIETFNLRERGIRKCIGLDGKNTKVIEPKSSEVKMVTRTRGLKVRDKLKELDIIKMMSTKLRPQIILNKYFPPSITSSNAVENLSSSSHEHKKQTKNTDDGNKRNSTLNVSNDKRHYRDLNVGSRVSVKKDNFNHEALGTPRTRTRSSLSKQKTISETKSSKESQGAAIISKETIKKKTLSTIKRQELAKHILNNGGLIPIVMLESRDLDAQRSVGLFKQQLNKQMHNQVQKPAETNIQLQKPPPKKRGRKRRVDVQNEKLQEIPRSNKETPKNCGKIKILEKEVEPLAKRTRRSLGLRNIKQESMSKQSVQPRKFKKQHVNKVIESIKTKKKVLKFVFNNLCKRSKYILSLDKKIKNLPRKCLDIVKFPIELKEIKKKITTGKIKNINELQFNLVMWSYNVQMIKRSDNIVFSEASNFQYELEKYCRSLKNAVNDQNVDKYKKENNPFYIHGDDRFNLRYSGAKKDPNDARITVNKETIANIYKFIDNSCDASSGSESDSYMPPKKKRKKNISDFSNSESD